MNNKIARKRSSKRPSVKKFYRIRNWKQYNQALIQRGSLSVWMDQAVLDEWLNDERSGNRGASLTYSDKVIEAALTLKVVYRLTLRATVGLLQSLLALMGLGHLPVPDYSTLCRRQKTLSVSLPRESTGKAMHLVVDSTGCKIYGEGEWKVRQHGISKRRTWRKLHVGVDESTGLIAAAMLTTNDVADSAMLEDLIEQVEEPISQLSGDGGYDTRPCYESLRDREKEQEQPLKVTIPPRHGARIWQHGNSKDERLARDENLRRIRQVGRKEWKEESDYHRRSLAETTMFRLKTIFGDKLSARDFDRQTQEVYIRCAALNRMTMLGMPESYEVQKA